jgi:hypothetical protein
LISKKHESHDDILLNNGKKNNDAPEKNNDADSLKQNQAFEVKNVNSSRSNFRVKSLYCKIFFSLIKA